MCQPTAYSASTLSLVRGTRHASRRYPLTQQRRGVEATRNIAVGVCHGVPGVAFRRGPALEWRLNFLSPSIYCTILGI